ncbi:MAG: SulP family inorganic anion transporter [Thermoanaerobaculia bacterium]|nr:putative sulfate transporter [Thermoanaerobaculia bacterium]MCK6685363.1 SulP family inorganic anion transporter [Thermoanaerobaculia bacterium]
MAETHQEKTLPFLDWARPYNKEWLGADLVAGLTTAAVVVPKSLAYATIAGLPIQAGLATAFIPAVVYALLGTSRPMSMSTTSTIAILTAAQIALVDPTGNNIPPLAVGATLAVLVGLMLIAARILRLGAVANLISDPVLTGFKAGIGLVIVLDQLPKLLGVHIPKGGFFKNVVELFRHLPETSIPTVILGGALLAGIVLLEHLAPKLPAPLFAVVAAVAASSLLGLEKLGISTVGNVPSGIPPFSPPMISLVETLWPGAAGIALMSFIETVAVGRAFRQRGEPQPDASRELTALGFANVAGGLFGCMPGGGGTSQSAVNRSAGARTQLTGLVTAAVTLASLLFLAPLISLMPGTALAAVVIATTVGLIKVPEFVEILKVRRTEFLWALAATAGVVLLGTLKGILIAVLVSVVSLAVQAAHPAVYPVGRKRGTDVYRRASAEHSDDETFPGLLMVRIIGRVFFLNLRRIGDDLTRLIQESNAKVVVIDFSAVIDLEYTALKALIEAEERMRAQGVLICLAALNPEARAAVERSALGQVLGRERMFFNLEQAVQKYPALLDRAGKN